MNVKCLLWHSECAEYEFLKIVSFHTYFCRYLYRCGKSCFASFVTKSKSISSICLVYQNLLTFLIRIPEIGVSLSYYFLWTQKPSCSFFSIFIFIHKTFSELIWKYPLTRNLYILTLLLKKLRVSVIRVCLKPYFTKFYSKSPREFVDMPCIIYHLS